MRTTPVRLRLFTAVLLLSSLWAATAAAQAQDERATFAGLMDVAPLDAEACKAIAAHVVARVTGEAAAPDLPAAVRDDAQPRAVFVSVSNGTDPARVVVAVERGALRAADAAVERVAAVVPDAAERQWIKVDVALYVQPLPSRAANLPLSFDTSLQGIVFDVGGGNAVALLPEEVTNRALVVEGRLRADAVAGYLAGDPRLGGADGSVQGRPGATHRFTTASFFVDAGSGETEPVPLYRGHRAFPPESLTRDDLLLAARAGAAYLAGATGDDGSFAYIYHADRDAVADDYNIVRHAATAWAMLELYRTTRAEEDKPAADAAVRALGYLATQVKPVKVRGEDVVGVVADDEVTLGGNAVAAMAYAEAVRATGDRTHAATALALGRALRAAQSSAGRFVVQRQRVSTGQEFATEHLYYPGEAALALAGLARIDAAGAAEWTDAAARATGYLVSREEAVPDHRLEHDHWVLYAIDAVYRDRPKAALLHDAMRRARAIVARQTDARGAETPDLAGSWGGGRSTPTATRVEGLMAAARLARDADRPDDAAAFTDAARRAVAFQLRCQVRPEQAMYFPHPTRVLGAFREDLRGTDVRIDFVQHAVTALLAVHAAMPQ